jgi:hypothetical protein
MKSKLDAIVVATTTLIAALASAAPLANAADDANNPLHPSYYANRTHASTAAPSTETSARYLDDRNPLHPGYYAARVGDGAFVGTASSSTQPYVDDRNPLHPAHRFY